MVFCCSGPGGSSFLTTIALISVALWAMQGCANDPAANSEEQTHHVRGIYLGSQFDGKVAVVHHETIPGIMDAMKMGFKLRNPMEIEAFSGGEQISFDLYIRGDEWEVGNVIQLPDSVILSLPESESMSMGHQH